MTYRHLTQDERYQIAALHAGGWRVCGIALELGRHPSTISRELRRNLTSLRYEARAAENVARQRRSSSCSRPKIDEAMAARIDAGLSSKLSPEQICGRMALEGHATTSRTSVYRYVHRRGWRHRLRLPKRRRPYGAGRARRFTDRKSIQTRPPEVASRERIGDWEADTVRPSCGTGVIVTLVERVTGFARVGWCARGTAEEVAAVIETKLWHLRDHVLSITCDRGSEFANDGAIEKGLSTQVYFADPHAPWQRGCNENFNGLLREYFPRSRDFSTITAEEAQHVEQSLNDRPRKRLSYYSPSEAFLGHHVVALRK
jgi:IS30 family transposase